MTVTRGVPKRGVGRPGNTNSETTKRQILTAARACFSAQGYAATTMRMVADAAGVASAAIYHHFGGKSDLMIAVHEDVLARSQARIQERTASAATAREMIAGVLDVIVDLMQDEPGVTFFEVTAFEEARRHPELAAIAEVPAFVSVLDAVTQRGVDTGEVDRESTEAVQQVLFAFVLGFAGMANHLDVAGARALAENCKKMIAGQLLAGASAELL